jgi:hypothetical protein
MTLTIGATLRGDLTPDRREDFQAAFPREAKAFLRSLAKVLEVPADAVAMRSLAALPAFEANLDGVTIVLVHRQADDKPDAFAHALTIRFPDARLATMYGQLQLVNRLRSRRRLNALSAFEYLEKCA